MNGETDEGTDGPTHRTTDGPTLIKENLCFQKYLFLRLIYLFVHIIYPFVCTTLYFLGIPGTLGQDQIWS